MAKERKRKTSGKKAPDGTKSRGKASAKPLRKPTRKDGATNAVRSANTDADERARKLALAIAETGLEHKALNVEIIDVRGKVDYSDFVVVMSGRSDRQVTALGRNIEQDVESTYGARCLGIEGMPQGTWLLMDYGDVVVHIFHEDTRGYYDLEALWIDAARVPVEDTAS